MILSTVRLIMARLRMRKIITITGISLAMGLLVSNNHLHNLGVSPDSVQEDVQKMSHHKQSDQVTLSDDYTAYKAGRLLKNRFLDKDVFKRITIDTNGSDVIVLLQIQKTGSTVMNWHLMYDIDVSPWCSCERKPQRNCDCVVKWKESVLFTNKRNDWPCGLHADWTYTMECAENVMRRRSKQAVSHRLIYMTMVRDPLRRYISEWLHVRRHATWADATYICNGRSASKQEIPPCYTTPNWTGVTLQEFMDCPSNLALNRQTRMLANLSLVNCYNTSGMSHDERHEKMLKSAKENLKNMPFFGLTSHQQLSQILFENTFNLKFKNKFLDVPVKVTFSGRVALNRDIRNKIIYLNRYDVMLHQYAKDLFLQRLITLAKTTSREHLREEILNKTYTLVREYEHSVTGEGLTFTPYR